MAMNKVIKKIPADVRACIWFANPDQIDLEKSKTMMVTQILNRGTWSAVQWAWKIYGEAVFREVVSQPKRGLWFEQTLNFWLLFFQISLDPQVYQKALFKTSV